MATRQDATALCDAFAEGLSRILGGKLSALYVHGAAAFPETEAIGDVDFHAILNERPTDAERAAILTLHELLAREHAPLGAELDGHYVSLADARGATSPTDLLRPPIVDDSWALHRAHIRAGRCIVLRGPDPKTIYLSPSWEEMQDALYGELDYVVRHLREYPDYCILNLCRLMYSFRTGDVVISKWGAAAWASEAFPAWRPAIDRAKRSYLGRSSADDRAAMLAEVDALLALARVRIESDVAERNPERAVTPTVNRTDEEIG